jgi:hypothetical protein
MGHGMAKNIALKMGDLSKLFVYDINQDAVDTFVAEYNQNGKVNSAGSPREIAEKCVCHNLSSDTMLLSMRSIVNAFF